MYGRRYLSISKSREVIDALGGLTAVSLIYGITPQSVWEWYHGKGIPSYRLEELKDRRYRNIPAVKEALREVL